MNFCNQCGQGNQEEAAFCVQCGAPLAAGAAGAEPPGATPKSGGAGAGPGDAVSPAPPPVPSLPGVPGPPSAAQPFYPPPPVPRGVPTDGFAVASLALSILSFAGCPFVAAILGLIFGYISLSHIAESKGALGGEPLAKAGIIISWIHIGLVLLAGILILILVLVGVIATN